MSVEAVGYSSETLGKDLHGHGFARLGRVLTSRQCNAVRALFDDDSFFRSTIDMARYRFGRGTYRYFNYPLPETVARLRQHYYPQLAPIASEWMTRLGVKTTFPNDLDEFLAQCHAAGQVRPTPLVLRYQAGDYNCLHQDIYGAIVFPFQVIVGLSDPDSEYSGGELLLVEQRPRAQSVGHVIRLAQGEAVAITTRYRPVKGTRGYYRTNFRHGVSAISAGERFTLGLIFHDAA